MRPSDTFDYPWPPPRLPPPPPSYLAAGWWCPGHPDISGTQALSHQIHLGRCIATLLTDSRNGRQLSQEDLEHSLRKMQTHVSGLGEWFTQAMGTIPYNEQRQDASATAQKVFDIPELFEMIVDHLPIHDVVRCTQVSTNIKATVENSAKIQTKMCLRATLPKSYLKTPLDWCFLKSIELPDRDYYYNCNIAYPTISTQTIGFSCRTTGFCSHHFGPVDVDKCTMGIEASFGLYSGQRLPDIGSRYRQMFICQPPLQAMDVHLTCCYTSSTSPFSAGYYPQPTTVDTQPITARPGSAGLQIGDLYDCAKKLLDQHRFCPFADPSLVEDDGTVRVGLCFRGIVVLQPTDPMVIKDQERQEGRSVNRRASKVRESKLRAFAAARRAAHKGGEPLPTLGDFEAEHEGEDWLAGSANNSPDPFPGLTYWAPRPPLPGVAPPPVLRLAAAAPPPVLTGHGNDVTSSGSWV